MRPMRGATTDPSKSGADHRHFNPRAPCGARPRTLRRWFWKSKFQSTRPMRGATGCRPTSGTSLVFQSTRPMRGATRMMMAERGVFSFQSTRPMRGATLHAATLAHFGRISIHAPLAGCDAVASSSFMYFARFQSTRPVRGATTQIHQNHRLTMISIHAPRAGRDSSSPWNLGDGRTFQSTRPVRGATHRP